MTSDKPRSRRKFEAGDKQTLQGLACLAGRQDNAVSHLAQAEHPDRPFPVMP